jgi:NAD(P)-dependent dehydrogenase (short-subunit alcohol dehydrogenase family)
LSALRKNIGAFRAPGQASKTSLDVFRRTFETNFFNIVALTQMLIPLAKRFDAGRNVFLSSGLGSLTQHRDPKWAFYNYKVPAL